MSEDITTTETGDNGARKYVRCQTTKGKRVNEMYVGGKREERDS